MNQRLKDLAMTPYAEAKKIREEKQNGKFIAWVTSDSPHAILEAMGIVCLYPENHAALCAARKVGDELSRVAENKGFDQNLCSYFRINLGSSISDKNLIEPLPRPDFLVCCSNICDTVVKWYQILGEVLNVPVFYIDVPFMKNGIDAPRKDRIIFYVKYQLNQLVEFLEWKTGERFHLSRAAESLALGATTTKLWQEILEINKAIPAQFTAFDAFSWMGPIVTQRVTKEGYEYYKILKDELKNAPKLFAKENFRLFWDNIAIWPKLRQLSQKLASLNAQAVVSSYTSCWAREEFLNPDPEDPLQTIASQLVGDFLNQGAKTRIEYSLKLIKDFSVDGLLIHANRSCKNYTNTGLELKRRAFEKLGLSSLIIEADQCDSRFYDEAKVEKQLEEFIGILQKGGDK